MEVSGQVHAPAVLRSSRWTGGWMGPSAGLDAVANKLNPE